jgi:hypothetical protein
MRRAIVLLVVGAFLLVACEDSSSEGPELRREAPAASEPARRLPGGRWNVGGFRTAPAEPFELTVVGTSIEAKNITDEVIAPVCLLTYGSQTGIVQSNLELEPGERAMVHGRVRFPRPLDDYESGGAGCYTRLPDRVAREVERAEIALTMGRPTKVPRLIGKSLDAALPSFRQGLNIEIREESTPCDEDRLIEMSRSFDPFGKTPCGDPIVTAQHPAPGAKSEVGATISITVGTAARSDR